MGTTVITVPGGAARHNWEYDLEAQLVAGNNVEFNDAAGNEINVPFVMVDTDTNLRTRKKDETKLFDHKFVKGGWHQHWMSFVNPYGYAAGSNAKVRFD
jgi:hypothetical protein